MKRLHLAIGVKNIGDSINDYQKRLNTKPVVTIKDEYALFRTSSLNLSIRKVEEQKLGLRHLGWEGEMYSGFTEEVDSNGFTWEHFRKEDQIKEILDVWPYAQSNNAYLQSRNDTSD